MVIGIIGGGASGMAAAIAASCNPHARVILFERQNRVGRKLQATGNGRCNLSNLHAGPASYHGDDPGFAAFALECFPVVDTLDWFASLGLVTTAETSGKVYPYSDQANSVVDVLRFALERDNITIMLDFEVQKVTAQQDGFLVHGPGEPVFCQKLIVACGGLAGTKLGGSMSGYQILKRLGHCHTQLRPALVQFRSSWRGCAQLKGVRANCRVRIFHDGVLHAHSAGELQFTDYGVSGPVIFEVSRDTCRGRGQWLCRLDLMPDMRVDDLMEALLRRKESKLTAGDLLTGILHNRLGRVVTQEAGIASCVPISQLSNEELERVARYVKELDLILTEPMGMEAAQVTAGGAVTNGFDPHTMQSRTVPGLYACGEVLDIDGDCGGYNLQWAWSSGRLAGAHAGGML